MSWHSYRILTYCIAFSVHEGNDLILQYIMRLYIIQVLHISFPLQSFSLWINCFTLNTLYCHIP